VILTANSIFEINEFITDGSEENPIDLYRSYQLAQFGNNQRGLLIEQWYFLDEVQSKSVEIVEGGEYPSY
jgi:hypothetical protein